jgi:hypothetical protein
MADLFGKPEDSNSNPVKKEFVLDEKYKKPNLETKEVMVPVKKNV